MARASEEGHSRLEELIIWKISDELKLPVKVEEKFAQSFRDLNAKKVKLSKKQNELLAQVPQVKNEKQKRDWLSQYRQVAKDLAQLSSDELEQMQKILGEDKVIQYLALKGDLSQRIRSLMVSPEKPSSAPSKLPPPKIIEEK